MYGRSEDEWDDLIVSGYDQLKQVARHGTSTGTLSESQTLSYDNSVFVYATLGPG